MKANELRIGNYVEVLNTEIQVIDVMCDSINTKSHENMTFDYVEPIPLTEEWLKRFGVTKDIDVWELTGVFWLQELEGGCFFLGCNSGWTGIEIKYVHQLQNLYFALTGEELEYDHLK